MAYDIALAHRIKEALGRVPHVTERKMFGGLAFLVDGRMTAVASSKGGLMIRVDPQRSSALVESTPAVFAEMRGRILEGWVRIASDDLKSDEDLQTWIDEALAFRSTLA